MSFAWELARYHTSSAGWYLIYMIHERTWDEMRWSEGGRAWMAWNKNICSIFQVHRIFIVHSRRLYLFPLIYFKGKIEKIRSKNMQKTRESSMIIANIHRQSYNSHVCSLQKSWLHQTGAPGLVNTTTALLFVYIFGLWFVYVRNEGIVPRDR